jgi:hypothetical protein
MQNLQHDQPAIGMQIVEQPLLFAQRTRFTQARSSYGPYHSREP